MTMNMDTGVWFLVHGSSPDIDQVTFLLFPAHEAMPTPKTTHAVVTGWKLSITGRPDTCLCSASEGSNQLVRALAGHTALAYLHCSRDT